MTGNPAKLRRDAQVVTGLAAADYRYERRMSLCLIIGLASVLVPLLVLFGLRYGIVSTLQNDLRSNPGTLQLQPLTQGRYDKAFFDSLQARDETRFLIPNTRFLAATVALHSLSAASSAGVDAEMIPTAKNDPLLKNSAFMELHADEVALSQSAAEKLKVAAGDTLTGRWGRIVGDRRESVQVSLLVKGVIPVQFYSRDAAFVPLELLLKAEDYREGFAVPAWQADGRKRQDGERLFAGFRLYAENIDAVEPLRDWLAARGIDTETRLSEIRLVQRLDYSLTLLFLVLAGLGCLGFGLSLSISLWGNMERKRYELAVLRLLGLPGMALALFPVVQAVFTAIGGCLLGEIFYFAAAALINHLFSGGLAATQVVCRLPAGAFPAAFLATLALAVSSAALAARQAVKFSPAEGLRYE